MTLRISHNTDVRGEIYAHLFENRAIGVPRALYWAVTLPCVPVAWDGGNWKTQITCEWLQWPIRNWTHLDGSSLSSVLEPQTVECSFYLSEHHPVRLEALTITRISGINVFRVQIAGSLDLEGFDDLDDEDIPFNVESEAVFKGVIVVADNLFPKPNNPGAVTAAMAPFIDLGNLGEPKWDRFRYVLAPPDDS